MLKVRDSKLILDLVGFGALNLDYWFQVPGIEPDTEQVVTEEGSSPGGSAANTAYALARLGATVGFVGAVGDDEAGRSIVDDFEENGILVTGIKRKTGPTGRTICLIDRQGRRSIFVSPGANNKLDEADIPGNMLRWARAFHFSSFASEKQFDLLVNLANQIPQEKILSFSPGALYAKRGPSALAPILARTDFLFLNQDELLQLTGQTTEEGIRELHRLGCRSVIVTLGGDATSRHWVVSDQQGIAWGKGRMMKHLPVIDSTGAGDAFAAGYLFAALSVRPKEACGAMGQTLAELCISRQGARAGIPSAKALEEISMGIFKEHT